MNISTLFQPVGDVALSGIPPRRFPPFLAVWGGQTEREAAFLNIKLHAARFRVGVPGRGGRPVLFCHRRLLSPGAKKGIPRSWKIPSRLSVILFTVRAVQRRSAPFSLRKQALSFQGQVFVSQVVVGHHRIARFFSTQKTAISSSTPFTWNRTASRALSLPGW